ncbi:NADH-dependent [FeFe] hydrogenase, group A6 [Halothermothrix orenii]|uniref:NADH dehydrogenase (Ubiquinone) 75 kDa subunit n=1 Tax=Halothermothrix orenii (strain H 168 / OCM 544 / DSM 9562) TaxID=373903 RepID=B8D2G3_HALOH|nr:NADH-dependent [FeFe] hydrogenase, group A6 [Halothermothrix orenii]ACL69390.1 NADH dehydrogenase (ubiquinone) 75 kDa subunit [Halothermothrix orenii H 168]
MSDKVNITLDGKSLTVDKDKTILEVAREAGIKIPTLCYLEEINEIGSCRVCVVEVNGKIQPACVTPVSEGLEITTTSPRIREARRISLELIISDHPMECLTCSRNGNCELQRLAEDFGISEITYEGEQSHFEPDLSSPSIVRDPDKCILCRRCVSVCEQVQGVAALTPNERGFSTIITPAFGQKLGEIACANCGQCINACPVGALSEKDDTEKVWEALANPDKHVVVQTAPAVRVSIGEVFGMKPGSLVTGKLMAGLRRLGFDKVFDTNFTADLTIMEEGHELIERLKNNERLPLITSCSPGWIKFIEHFYPSYLEHISSCKSPQQMFGALAKTYYPENNGIDPEDVFVVSVMPCTAKKFEITRPGMDSSGYQDVDVVLTTRELAKMFKQAGIDFVNLPDEEYDKPLGISTGAGTIFGTTGGVMEAALRTAYEVLTGEELPGLEFEDVRGLEGIKECEIEINGQKIKVAVAHGLSNAHKVLQNIDDYHFIEIMACPGGCVGGGGQPYPTNEETIRLRAQGLYRDDKEHQIRKSHENPVVKKLYEEFLGKPLSHKSHELLHTGYVVRSKYPANVESDAV